MSQRVEMIIVDDPSPDAGMTPDQRKEHWDRVMAWATWAVPPRIFGASAVYSSGRVNEDIFQKILGK